MSACDIGMVGLGVMGRNLLLNMLNKGFSVAGYDTNPEQVERLIEDSEKKIQATTDIQAFINSLKVPRAIMILVPAGSAVDSVIEHLLPYLNEGDLMIDAGNSYFKDTDVRMAYLQKKGIDWMGVGLSGGEEGARRGPSIMPGGTRIAYERVCRLFKAISAQVNGEPCQGYLGPGSAGHFVKMVHNGIEYGMMQLIAETFHLMRYGFKLGDEEIGILYTEWNTGLLKSYLIEITADIFKKKDEGTGNLLLNAILGVARQNGTGLWTSRSAMELQVPTPTIDIAVIMRDMSVLQEERAQASLQYSYEGPEQAVQGATIEDVEHALYSGFLMTYAQGMSLLKVASDVYHYQLLLEQIAQLWRGGCIIRAVLLEDIANAFKINPTLPNLLLDSYLSHKLLHTQKGLRTLVGQAAHWGIPAPGLMASLSYFDTYRHKESPANLIQAQRDFFGAHLYERIDKKGSFHTQW